MPEYTYLIQVYNKTTGSTQPVYNGTLSDLVRSYMQARKYKIGDTVQNLLWLISEAGELSGAVVNSQSQEWVRNHDHSDDNVAGEMADVLMMDTAVGYADRIDPLQAFLDKIVAKGCRIMPDGVESVK